jgi:hypothetical protein
MTSAMAARVYFSEARGLRTWGGAEALNWLRAVEIDPELALLKGPKWVYAFRCKMYGEVGRFSLYAVLIFDKDGYLEVQKGGPHLKAAPSMESSGRVAWIQFPTVSNGHPDLWMFVTSRFALDDVSLRELQRYTLSLPSFDGVYFAESPYGRVRFPVVDLSARPIAPSKRREFHWGGSVFEDGGGNHTLLALDFITMAQRMQSRALVAQQKFLAFTQPAHAKDSRAVEVRTLKRTLARLLDGVCRNQPSVQGKLRTRTAASDFIENDVREYRKLNGDAQRSMARYCALLESPFFDLWCSWFQLIRKEDVKVVALDEMTALLEGLENSPRGLLTLAEPPDHFMRLLEEIKIDNAPPRKVKDYVSFGRKHVRPVVEFSTKFVPGFIVGSRLQREFGNPRMFLWTNVEPGYQTTVIHGIKPGDTWKPATPDEMDDLKQHLSSKFAAEVPAEDLREAIKKVGQAADVMYWIAILGDLVTSDDREIGDYARAVSAINGGLKMFLWEPWAKEANIKANLMPDDPSQLLVGPWDKARAAAVKTGAAKTGGRMAAAKTMLRIAPYIGALCDLAVGLSDYNKARESDDDTAAVAGLAGGVFAALAGMTAIVPASMLGTSSLLAALVPGAGWALLTAAAAAAVVHWLFTDSDWENFAEHCVFGALNANNNPHQPDWAYSGYDTWDESIGGLRTQILSAHSLLCRFEIKSWGDGFEVQLGFYEPEMTLVVNYQDPSLNEAIKVEVHMRTGRVECKSVRIKVAVTEREGRVASVRIVPSDPGSRKAWSGSLHREAEVYLWPQTGNVTIPREPAKWREAQELPDPIYF